MPIFKERGIEYEGIRCFYFQLLRQQRSSIYLCARA